MGVRAPARSATCGEGRGAPSRAGAAAAAVYSGSRTSDVQRSPISAAVTRTAEHRRRLHTERGKAAQACLLQQGLQYSWTAA